MLRQAQHDRLFDYPVMTKNLVSLSSACPELVEGSKAGSQKKCLVFLRGTYYSASLIN